MSILPKQVATYHIVFWYLGSLHKPFCSNIFNFKEDSSWHTSVSVPKSASSEALAIARVPVCTVGSGGVVGVLGVAAMRGSVPGSFSVNQDSTTTTSAPSTSITATLPGTGEDMVSSRKLYSREVKAFDRDVFEADTASLSSSNTCAVTFGHPTISGTVLGSSWGTSHHKLDSQMRKRYSPPPPL